MKISALYSNGETLSWSDRLAIACLQKKGFPLDYISFITRFGPGEIPFILTVHRPERLLSAITDDAGRLEVGHTDDGLVWAVREDGKVVFEVNSSDGEVDSGPYASWEEVITVLHASREVQFGTLIYTQFHLPVYSLRSEHPETDVELVEGLRHLSRTIGERDSSIFTWYANTFAVFQTHGWMLIASDYGSITISYRLESPPTELIKLLSGRGWVHDPNEKEDAVYDLLVGKR